MLELLFKGFVEWTYGIALEIWEYFASVLLELLSMDYAYLRSHVPIMDEMSRIILAIGWALLIGNLVFQAIKSMTSGLGFEGEDPKLLFTRTFVFGFLLLASPQICALVLGMTSTVMNMLGMPDAVDITFLEESSFGGLTNAWLLVAVTGMLVMFKVFRLIVEIAEQYIILGMLTLTAPMAFGMGGSKNTQDIFNGWCRTFGSMCVLMLSNVVFFKMILSVLSVVPSGIDVLPWMMLVFGIIKVARKFDSVLSRLGLNPVTTGGVTGGRSIPGMVSYAVMRRMGHQAAQAAATGVSSMTGHSSAGKGSSGPRVNVNGGGASKPGSAGGGTRHDATASAQATGQQNSTTRNSENHSAKNSGNMEHNTTAQESRVKSSQTAQSFSSAQGTAESHSAFTSNSTGGQSKTSHTSDTRRSSVPPGTKQGPSRVRAETNAPGTRPNVTTAGMSQPRVTGTAPHITTQPGTAGKDASSPNELRTNIHTQNGPAGTPAAPSANFSEKMGQASARYSSVSSQQFRQAGGSSASVERNSAFSSQVSPGAQAQAPAASSPPSAKQPVAPPASHSAMQGTGSVQRYSAADSTRQSSNSVVNNTSVSPAGASTVRQEQAPAPSTAAASVKQPAAPPASRTVQPVPGMASPVQRYSAAGNTGQSKAIGKSPTAQQEQVETPGASKAPTKQPAPLTGTAGIVQNTGLSETRQTTRKKPGTPAQPSRPKSGTKPPAGQEQARPLNHNTHPKPRGGENNVKRQ